MRSSKLKKMLLLKNNFKVDFGSLFFFDHNLYWGVFIRLPFPLFCASAVADSQKELHSSRDASSGIKIKICFQISSTSLTLKNSYSLKFTTNHSPFKFVSHLSSISEAIFYLVKNACQLFGCRIIFRHLFLL